MPESRAVDFASSPIRQSHSAPASCNRLSDPLKSTIDQLQFEVDDSIARRTAEAYELQLQVDEYKHRNGMLEERIVELGLGLQEMQAVAHEPLNEMQTLTSRQYLRMLKIMKSQVELVQKNSDIITSSFREEMSSLMEEKVSSELCLLNRLATMEHENRKLESALLKNPMGQDSSQEVEVSLHHELQRLRNENLRLQKSQSSLSGSMDELQRENLDLRRRFDNVPMPTDDGPTIVHLSGSQESEGPTPNHGPRSEDPEHSPSCSHFGLETVELSVSQQALETLQDEVLHVVDQIKAKDTTIVNLKAELEEYKSREHALSGRLKRNSRPTSNLLSLPSLHQEPISVCGSSEFEEATVDDTFWDESIYEEITVA